jgi:hypothetical protein
MDSANFAFTEFSEVRHALQCPTNTKYTPYSGCTEFCNHSYLSLLSNERGEADESRHSLWKRSAQVVLRTS